MTAVSVIIPVWNRADVILRAVRSVLAQTAPGVEVVVVDNGSSDGTADVVDALGQPNVTVLRLASNLGAAGGRNAGLKLAQGQFVGFLDSDDELDPRWAELMMAAVAHGEVLVTCGFAMLNVDGSLRYEHGSEPLGAAFSNLIGPFQAGTFLVQRQVLCALRGYVDSLQYSENTELALRVGLHCTQLQLRTAAVDLPLMRWHHDQTHVYDVAARRASCAYLLSHHDDLLSRDARVASSYRAQLAVWDARSGDLRSARRHFWAAWLARPQEVGNFARLAVTTISPLARRIWPQTASPR